MQKIKGKHFLKSELKSQKIDKGPMLILNVICPDCHDSIIRDTCMYLYILTSCQFLSIMPNKERARRCEARDYMVCDR